MSLALRATNAVLTPGTISYVAASGGSLPYVYSVVPNGAGGSVGSVTGLYTPPATISSDPNKLYDTIQVVDYNGGVASTRILVGDALILFCEIIQRELGLADGRVFLWDQKLERPKDNDLYIAVSVVSCKPFSNTNRLNSSGESEQSVNMQATLQIDVISRGPAARTRKEEVILALNSNYAQSQQERNSFYIGKLPAGSRFVNLSEIDGMAIPYRYSVSVNLQYMVKKTKVVSYIDTYSTPTIITDP
jgi:hypothetical protein